MSYQDDYFRESFPDEFGLQISDVAIAMQTVVIGIQSIQTRACCPGCDQPSERVHSHYRRQVADLPWQGRLVVLRITLRRFRCAYQRVSNKSFAKDSLPYSVVVLDQPSGSSRHIAGLAMHSVAKRDLV